MSGIRESDRREDLRQPAGDARHAFKGDDGVGGRADRGNRTGIDGDWEFTAEGPVGSTPGSTACESSARAAPAGDGPCRRTGELERKSGLDRWQDDGGQG
jgi:hypothetical protein